jgi:hypothetical protein
MWIGDAVAVAVPVAAAAAAAAAAATKQWLLVLSEFGV